MTDITIPPEALEAADRAYMQYNGTRIGAMNAACLAMLKSWPMKQHRAWDDVLGLGAIIILPLTENSE